MGLLIGLFFSVSPLPAVLTAVTKDKNALNSISIPGSMMGLSCSTAIMIFCGMKGMTECTLSCAMGITSCMICLIAYTSLNSKFPILVLIIISQIVLAYLVAYVFPPEVTDIIMSTLNYLACCTISLDTLDKILTFRDASFCSYSMNVLNALSCLIWGIYH